jgi:hypothetical protein
VSEPLKLPDDPTPHDLAKGLTSVHECLDAARAEIRQVSTSLTVIQSQNALMWPAFDFMAKFATNVQRFGKFVAGSLIVALITAFTTLFIQNQINHDAAIQAASQAAQNAKVAAVASTTVSKQLHNLGAD